jgi:hypothetical protein
VGRFRLSRQAGARLALACAGLTIAAGVWLTWSLGIALMAGGVMAAAYAWFVLDIGEVR